MKPNESESDDKGVYLSVEVDDDSGQEWYLLHGGDTWRPPWTY